MKVAESVLDLIGGMPLVKIKKLNPNKNKNNQLLNSFARLSNGYCCKGI